MWWFMLLQDASLPTGDGNIFHSLGLFDVPPISYNAAINHVVWHMRLAHPSSVVYDKLSQHTKFSSWTKNNASLCIISSLAKSHKQPFHPTHVFSSHVFYLLYMDICTSLALTSTGAKYFLLIVDDYTQFMWIYFLQAKS